MIGLHDLVNIFRRLWFGVEHETKRGLHFAGEEVLKAARDKLGHYQPRVGPFPAWEQLHYVTLYGGRAPNGHLVPGKIALGQATESAHNPGIATGAMRDSLRLEVHAHGGMRGQATIISDLPQAAFFEFGTKWQSPRPFMGPALFQNEERVRDIMVHYAVRGLVSAEFAARLVPITRIFRA